MEIDNERPKATITVAVGDNLDDLSVEELELRIGDLQAEIARTEAEIANKKSTKSAAESVFKF